MMKIEKIRAWCPEAEAGLSGTFGRDHDSIVAGVNRGHLELYRLWDGQAYMITRVDRGVLTCCCYQGARLVEAMRWMRAQSARLGLTEILFYTRRPALKRLLSEFNFELDDYVFRAKVAA